MPGPASRTLESDSQVGRFSGSPACNFHEKKTLTLSRRGAAPVNFLDVLSTLIVSARKIDLDL